MLKNNFFKYAGLIIILVLSFSISTGFTFNEKEQFDHDNPINVRFSTEKVDNQYKVKANFINKSSKPVEIKYSESPYSLKINSIERNPQVVLIQNASKDITNTKILEPNESFVLNKDIEELDVQSGKYLADIGVEYNWRNGKAGYVFTQENINIPVNINNNVSNQISNPKFNELQIRKDIEEALSVDLSKAKQYEFNDLDQLLNPKDHYLVKVFKDIEGKAMKGDYLPTLFVNDNTAYFILQKADGKNYVYSISKKESQWDIRNIVKKEI